MSLSSLSYTLSDMSGSTTEESLFDDLETTFTSDYDEEPTTEELLANDSVATAKDPNDNASDKSVSTSAEESTCRSVSSIVTNLSTTSATWAIVSDLESTTTEGDESDLESLSNEADTADEELAKIADVMATAEEFDRPSFNAEKMLNSGMFTCRESFSSSSLASVSDEEDRKLAKEIGCNVARRDVQSKSADELNTAMFSDDGDQVYEVSNSTEMRQVSDEYDFEIVPDAAPLKPFVAPKPSGRKVRAANQLQLPPPVDNSPFPLSSNPNAVDDAYNQWAFWQWALYGGPWSGNSGATTGHQDFPLSSSEMPFPSYNQFAHFQPQTAQPRSSSAPGCSYTEMPLEDAFPPHASYSHRINYDQPQAFLSARGGYNRVEPGPINFTEMRRHLEGNNYKPRFFSNPSQTGLRGGGFDGSSSSSYNSASRDLSSESSQRASGYSHQWSGGSKRLANSEEHLSRETAKLSLNDDDSQKWYEFQDFTGDCRLAESRSSGSTRGSRGGGGGTRGGNHRTDNRQRGGGYGQGRGSQGYRPGARGSAGGYSKPLY